MLEREGELVTIKFFFFSFYFLKYSSRVCSLTAISKLMLLLSLSFIVIDLVQVQILLQSLHQFYFVNIDSLLSYSVIMIPPFGFFGIFVGCFHIESIIWGSFLFSTTGQHTDYTKADWLYRQGRRPVIRQYRKTNMTITVNMWMNWNIVTNKSHLWWLKWIAWAKLETKFETFSII